MRLRTLPVSVAGVIAGTAIACMYRSFRVAPAIICLFFAIGAQVVSNFANEYFDFKGGLDKPGREGFRRGVTEGDLTPRAMRNATFGLLCATALLGSSLIAFGGWWLVIPGVLIAIFALAYSAGPYPLSHHGLGDVAVVIFFGFVPVVLTAYVQMGEAALRSEAWPAGLAVGLLAANVLIVNNYRDMDDDSKVSKHTTVVIFGRRVMSTVYLVGGLTAMWLIALAIPQANPANWCLAVAGMAGVIALYRSLRQRSGAQLNPLLGKTAILLLATSILFLVLSLFFPLDLREIIPV